MNESMATKDQTLVAFTYIAEEMIPQTQLIPPIRPKAFLEVYFILSFLIRKS